jgi:hypothetical protein
MPLAVLFPSQEITGEAPKRGNASVEQKFGGEQRGELNIPLDNGSALRLSPAAAT